MSRTAAHDRLMAVDGIGPWTVAQVGLVALGDADAVPVGDFHLANQARWALANEPHGDDARMLELPEPDRGHRGRVIRLLGIVGPGAPQYGPPAARRDIAPL